MTIEQPDIVLPQHQMFSQNINVQGSYQSQTKHFS